MKNERDCRFEPKRLIVLALVSGTLISVQLVTMALAVKDRKIAELNERVAKIEDQNRQFLSSLLAGANGSGYSVNFDPYNSVAVSCKIEFEWVQGRFYYGDAGRRIPKSILTAKR